MTVPQMGYEVGPRLELGDSIALNISDPANPAVSAVIQAGPTDEGVITVNQNKNIPVGSLTPDADQPDVSAVSSSDQSE